jgi:transposase
VDTRLTSATPGGYLVKDLLPEPSADGRPEKHPRREIVNAILYLVRSGCPWRYLPADLPPWQTVYGANTVGETSRGHDAGKKSNGRKRITVTDTAGLLITVAVLAASCQDRDGGKTALFGLYLTSPIRHVFADQGFAGRFVDWAATTLRTTVEIMRKPADQRGFAVHPRRWVVERTLAWLTAHRRLARDYERHPELSEAVIRSATINGMLQRIRPRPFLDRHVPDGVHPHIVQRQGDRRRPPPRPSHRRALRAARPHRRDLRLLGRMPVSVKWDDGGAAAASWPMG